MLARSRRRSLWVALSILCSLIALAILAAYLWLVAGLPPLDDLQRFAGASSSKVYDRHGALLFEMPPPYTGRHSPVPLDEMPQALRQAVVATEDASCGRRSWPGGSLVGTPRTRS
jgi:membrane carboxypeptidase/penicillin-binding protein